MRIKIDGEIYSVSKVYSGGYLPMVETEEGPEFYVAKDNDEAGQAAYKYWEEMAHSDRDEFACIIGTERLIQWGLGESDSFGISSMTEFFERNAEVPEENFASYDGQERDVQRVGRLADDLGFTPTVAYRHN